MKKIGLAIFLLLTLEIFAQTDSFKKVTVKNITFEWKVEGKNLHVKLRAKTLGWIGVGFNPTKIMKDANIIIAYVKDGKVTIRDDFGTKEKRHASDIELGGQDNILNAKGTEENGATSIEFSIPLDSGDIYDQKLIPGKEYKIMFAMGEEDSFTKKHKKKTKVTITL